MKLLNTYDEKSEAEKAETLITGNKRLASERDGTETVYNLFGQPTWSNFYKLGMFELPILKQIVKQRNLDRPYDHDKYREIISMLKNASKSYELEIPPHWL